MINKMSKFRKSLNNKLVQNKKDCAPVHTLSGGNQNDLRKDLDSGVGVGPNQDRNLHSYNLLTKTNPKNLFSKSKLVHLWLYKEIDILIQKLMIYLKNFWM